MDITKPFWSLIACRFWTCFPIRFIQVFFTLFEYISVLFVFRSRYRRHRHRHRYCSHSHSSLCTTFCLNISIKIHHFETTATTIALSPFPPPRAMQPPSVLSSQHLLSPRNDYKFYKLHDYHDHDDGDDDNEEIRLTHICTHSHTYACIYVHTSIPIHISRKIDREIERKGKTELTGFEDLFLS